MEKMTVPIKGMHCRSCEILIEERIREIPGVKSVSVNYKKSLAIIYSEHRLNTRDIEGAVREAGYEVGVDDSTSWISLNPTEYLNLVLSGLFLLILYFIAKKTGIINVSVGGGNPSSLLVVLLVGLTAGVSTCMALVGGLILGISARHSEKHPEATTMQKFRPHLFFNLGRISSYFILGGLIGLVGKAFQLSGTFLGLLIIIVGIVMLVLGLQLTAMFPKLSSGTFTLPSSISKFLGIKKHHQKEYSHTNSVLVGALTFFLPCGFTQAMQLYAMTTGSFLSGALIMGTFALGTAPGLLGIGGLASVLKGSIAKKFYKFTGLLVVVLAIINIGNGYRLTGWNLSLNNKTVTSAQAINDPNVKIVNGIQEVRMDQLGGGYKPNKFTIKNNIPVKWIITSKNAEVCAASIVMSKMGIKKILKEGENVIEFTPKETGELRFSCLMGMYSGSFTVTENKDISTNQNINTENKNSTSGNSNIPEKIPDSSSDKNKVNADSQLIVTTYNKVEWDVDSDITPNEFTVNSGKPVHFLITANADGEGCMSTIMIPGLVNRPELLEKGKTITFDFTPTKKGDYDITCAMGVPRGKIKVV